MQTRITAGRTLRFNPNRMKKTEKTMPQSRIRFSGFVPFGANIM